MNGILTKREEFKIQAERYLKDKWPNELPAEGGNFVLQPIRGGTESILLSLHTNNSRPLILRGFKRLDKFKGIIRAYHHLTAAGVNVPKIIYIDSSRQTFRKYGYYLVFEEKIQGKTWSRLQDPLQFIPVIAEGFSKMHRVRSQKWGFIGRRIRWGFHLYILKEIREWLKCWKRFDSKISENDVNECWRWFKEKRKIAKKYKIYSLIHGEPTEDNIVFTSDGRMFLLDFSKVKYFPFLVDISILEKNFSEDIAMTFEKYYCNNLSEQQLEEFYNCRDFYECFVLLKWIREYAFRSDRLDESDPKKEYWGVKLANSKKLMLDIVYR